MAVLKDPGSMFRSVMMSTVVIVALAATIAPLSADEQLLPLAISGDWVTLAHRPSLIAPPDVCLVGNPARGVALRAGFDGLQFRVANPSWSLPGAVRGNIWITVGDWQVILDIDENSSTMVSAELAIEVVAPMLAAMDKATVMVVTVGKAKPVTVSLAGSKRATNAFRTCAGIAGSGQPAGENPFD